MVAGPFLNNMNRNFYECEPKAIPISLILEAIKKCEYGTVLSLAVQFRFLTGCRGKELDKIDPNKQSDGFIYWQLGKNQTKEYRKEYLPKSWWVEYDYYLHNTGVPKNKLFHVSNETLRTYFCKHLRPHLSAKWNEKITVMRSGQLCLEYRHTWGGFRKTFQTLLFAYFIEKHNNAELAAQLVSKRMKHKSVFTTVKHYLDDLEYINAKDYLNVLPFELVCQPRQDSLYKFYV